MIAQSAARRGVAGFAIFTLAMVALFVGLGLWQLQRRAEKHALIAALTERLAAAPEPLPLAVAVERADAGAGRIPPRPFYRDVSTRPGRDGLQFRLGACARIFPGPAPGLSCRRGCQPARRSSSMPVSCRTRCRIGPSRIAPWRGSSPPEPVALTGYIRFPEAAGMLTPAPRCRQAAVVRAGSSRDGAGARLGRASRPFYIDLEAPVPANGIPKPGPLEVHLKDDHLQYAITWFALAGAVAIAFGLWLRGRRLAASQSK